MSFTGVPDPDMEVYFIVLEYPQPVHPPRNEAGGHTAVFRRVDKLI
ncbi:hypothetical protein [Microbacterium sp. A84]